MINVSNFEAARNGSCQVRIELSNGKTYIVGFITSDPLLQNAAFMKVTLEDLQKAINENGVTDSYQNGANQSGTKASADLQAYNSLAKVYNALMDKLSAKLPKEIRQSKLSAMMNE